MASVANTAAAVAPIVIALFLAPQSQAQPAAPMTFEVASVKPHKAAGQALGFPRFLPGGRFTSSGVPLQIVIAVAYNLPFQGTQLSGGPDWIRSMDSSYDIDAKANADDLKNLSPEDRAGRLRVMLQALLAERFKLVIRRDLKEQPVYLLTVGKNGARLQKSKFEEKDCDDPANQCHFGGAGQGRGIHAKAFNMAELVVSVSNFTDRPLLDRTGLTGLYDIDTEGWVPLRPRPARPDGPTAEDIAMADPARPTLNMIFDKLGLKMESSKAPVELFVVEKVDKPVEN